MRGQPATPGRFCYLELATSDPEGAKAFYGPLFGWVFEVVPSSLGGYHLIKLDGELVGGLFTQTPAMAAQEPHWIGYVRVTGIDELAARIPALGGQVLHGPFDVAQVARMLVMQDPSGAVVCFWQSAELAGATVFDEPGALAWMELHTPDPAGCRAFYQALLGWTFTTSTDHGFEYTEFQAEGLNAGGMMPMEGPEWEGIPPHWMGYLAVADVDAAAAQVTELGGGVCVPPTDIPDVGRFAVVNDPQGATFSLIRLGCPTSA